MRLWYSLPSVGERVWANFRLNRYETPKPDVTFMALQ